MNMREKMARALCCRDGCQNSGGDYDPIRGVVVICQAHTFLKDVDAILDAMREPSEEMFNKIGLGKEFLLTDETGSRFLANIPNCKTIWQAMIDAIEMENNAPFMGLLNKAGK